MPGGTHHSGAEGYGQAEQPAAREIPAGRPAYKSQKPEPVNSLQNQFIGPG